MLRFIPSRIGHAQGGKFTMAPAKLGVSAALLSAVASGAHLTGEI